VKSACFLLSASLNPCRRDGTRRLSRLDFRLWRFAARSCSELMADC
jgi:hypothetical protein